METVKNLLLTDHHGKPIPTDIFYEPTGRPKPVVIYAHGFNGFKDWGRFDLIASRFAAAGIVFVKFNFSFNGTTPEQPETFTDLDAYAENNYTKELDNLHAVINWVSSEANPYAREIDKGAIGLLGHSLGGGIVLLTSSEDERVKAVATWASISECKTPWGSWSSEKMQDWKRTGVAFIANSRTKQQMPLHYQLYEDFVQHQDRLSIESAVKRLWVPLLICHGSADPGVPVASAYQLQKWYPQASLFILDTDHVFGRKHPWVANDLQDAMEQVLQQTIGFFSTNLILV